MSQRQDLGSYGQFCPVAMAHGLIATLLAGFIILHVLAAFYHQFVRKDGLFRRMFFGRRMSSPSTPAA